MPPSDDKGAPPPGHGLDARTFLLPLALLVAAGEWVEYKSPDGAFTVLFPAPPEVQAKQVQGVTVRIVAAQGEGLNYGIQYHDLPGPIRSKQQELTALKDFHTGFHNASKGKLLRDQEFSLSGAPGREMTIEMPNGLIMNSHAIVTRDRMYSLLVVGQDQKAIDSPDAKKFLGSFRLLNYTPPVYPDEPKQSLSYRIGSAMGTLLCVAFVFWIFHFLASRGRKQVGSAGNGGELARGEYNKGMQDLGRSLIALGLLQLVIAAVISVVKPLFVLLLIIGILGATFIGLGTLARKGVIWVNHVVAVISSLLIVLNLIAVGANADNPDSAASAGGCFGMLIPFALLYYSGKNLQMLRRLKSVPAES